jgi:hypothetical protein
VQAEFQEGCSLNHLRINNLDDVLEPVELGQIGLPRLEIWGMRMKIGGMMRSARGWDKLSQAFACLVATNRVLIAHDRISILRGVSGHPEEEAWPPTRRFHDRSAECRDSSCGQCMGSCGDVIHVFHAVASSNSSRFSNDLMTD